jgi:putative FmdB family regulatory protein
MPIYEYKCNKCGVFEVTQRITEKALKRCPTCKGRIERIISNTSFVLKGTGWYVTDYAKRGSGTPSGTADGASAEGESKSADAGGDAANGKSPGPEKPAPATAGSTPPATAPSTADKSAD